MRFVEGGRLVREYEVGQRGESQMNEKVGG